MVVRGRRATHFEPNIHIIDQVSSNRHLFQCIHFYVFSLLILQLPPALENMLFCLGEEEPIIRCMK